MAERRCRVRFHPSQKSLEVLAGTRLLEAARLANLPLASSCDGDAICGRCRVEVLAGAECLGSVSLEEARLIERCVRDEPGIHRMACEARVEGDVMITTGYW